MPGLAATLLAFTLLTAALSGQACAGGRPELTIAEYFDQLAAVTLSFHQQQEALERELAGMAEGPERERADLARGMALYGEERAGLKEIDPPPEVQSAHNEFLAATEALDERLEQLAREGESVGDLHDALHRHSDACFALEDIARQHSGEFGLLECPSID